MPNLKKLHQPFATADAEPKKILSSEIIRAKPSLKALGIRFSVSYAKKRIKAGKPRKLPYFACRYNVGDLGDINIVAFHYPLITDWDLMEKDADAYRMRIRSAIREEMIHSIQIITVRQSMGSEATLRHRKIWYNRKSLAVHGRNIAAGRAKTDQPESDVG